MQNNSVRTKISTYLSFLFHFMVICYIGSPFTFRYCVFLMSARNFCSIFRRRSLFFIIVALRFKSYDSSRLLLLRWFDWRCRRTWKDEKLVKFGITTLLGKEKALCLQTLALKFCCKKGTSANVA